MEGNIKITVFGEGKYAPAKKRHLGGKARVLGGLSIDKRAKKYGKNE